MAAARSRRSPRSPWADPVQFLLFTLYAPMASFGEIAVGEQRMGWTRPSRSAVLGLVAAARGCERTDREAHEHLQGSLHYAVRTDALGPPLFDYHTTQTPTARRGVSHQTRREELDADALNTVLSTREWRTDAYFTACLWPRNDNSVDLDELASALHQPCFVLYLGRKSAPLGLPLNPVVVEAATLLEAFDKRQANAEETRLLAQLRSDPGRPKEIAFDAEAPDDLVGRWDREERRRDAVVDRERWQFADRLERVIVAGEPSGH